MKCPECGGLTRVVSTTHRHNFVRRYKACTVCEYRFRTSEQIDNEGKHFPLREHKIGIKMNPQKVSELRRLRRDGGMTIRELAERYDITANYVKKICSRKAWKHIL